MSERNYPSPEFSILTGLLSEQLQRFKSKTDFWGLNLENIPQGESWTVNAKITLEKFLSDYPLPRDNRELVYWGIAWEFVWGKEPPQEITDLRKNLLDKTQSGEDLNRLEKMWSILIALDTDMF